TKGPGRSGSPYRPDGAARFQSAALSESRDECGSPESRRPGSARRRSPGLSGERLDSLLSRFSQFRQLLRVQMLARGPRQFFLDSLSSRVALLVPRDQMPGEDDGQIFRQGSPPIGREVEFAAGAVEESRGDDPRFMLAQSVDVGRRVLLVGAEL